MPSLYCGKPLSVLREIAGMDILHPRPNSLFPDPELYDSCRDGTFSLRAGAEGRGMLRAPVPLTAFTENFSSMPLIAPPPLGRVTEGACRKKSSSFFFSCWGSGASGLSIVFLSSRLG